MAEQIQSIEGDSRLKVEAAYKKVMGKNISPEKTEILLKLFEDTNTYYKTHEEEAHELVKTDNLELASLTVMMNVLMNMDEFIVKS